jgi:Tfp pilus assembly protein PilF
VNRLRLGVAAAFILLAGGGFFGWRFWKAQQHFQAGARALQQRDLDEARDQLDRCLALRSGHRQARLLAARAARLAGDLESALRHLDHAADLFPESDPDLRLERTLLEVRADRLTPVDERYLWSKVEAGDRDESILILECLAPAYLRDYRLGDCLHSLDAWLEVEPGCSQALLLRGMVHQGLGHLDHCEADFRAALTADSSNEEAQLYLALYLLNRNIAEATALLRRLHMRHPQRREVVLNLARGLLSSDVKESMQLLDGWLEQHSRDAAALALRGQLEFQRDNWSGAADFLKQSLEIDPSDSEAVHQMYTCCVKLKRTSEASQWKKELDRIEADVKALHAWKKLAGEKPNDPEPRYEAAQICLRNGQVEEALRWFSGALVCDPAHILTHRALAGYFERKGDQERAALHRRRAGM